MTASGNQRVIGIGTACLDQLLVWEDTAAPVAGNRIVASDLQGGGMAATAMAAVCRLGGEAELWAVIGDDWVGEQIIRALEMEGVDAGQVVRVAGDKSPFVAVCVDRKSGERHFLPMNHRERPVEAIGDLRRLRGAGCLLIDHALPESELPAAREARRLGVPVVSDTESFDARHRDVFAFVDYAVVSEEAARELYDDVEVACRAIREMGPGCVVVTLGDRGLVYLDGDCYGRMPAFGVDVVDTTGAGDVFHGAFCYGLVQGFPLASNLTFASAVAALKCRRIGGRAGIPSREEVEEFLRENGVEPATFRAA